MTEPVRIKREPPVRTGPRRTQAAAASTPAEPAGGNGSPPSADATSVSESVARAVRMGYDVIGQNIEEGRLAAERFRAGQYNIRDVPQDLSALSLRLLGVTRELSATTFDILEKLLQDPTVLGAVKFERQPPATAVRDPVAPSRPDHPPESPSPPDAAVWDKSNGIALTCTFKGARTAVARAATLARPKTPTALSLAGLASLDSAVPPIRQVIFSPAPDGYGVVAEVTIADDQPAGLYSGVVCGADTQLPLGLLTIQILP